METFLDIEPAKKNVATIRQFLKEDLNFDEIIETPDATHDEMDSTLKTLKNKMKAASKSDDEKLHVFVFYAGHGVMQTTTIAVLNSEHKAERYYPLEKRIQTLTAHWKNTFTQVLLDCCRQ